MSSPAQSLAQVLARHTPEGHLGDEGMHGQREQTRLLYREDKARWSVDAAGEPQ